MTRLICKVLLAAGVAFGDQPSQAVGHTRGVVVEVAGDRYATHLFGAQAQDYRILPDASKAPERFRLLIGQTAVRAEIISDVGMFSAGTILLTAADSNQVTVLSSPLTLHR